MLEQARTGQGEKTPGLAPLELKYRDIYHIQPVEINGQKLEVYDTSTFRLIFSFWVNGMRHEEAKNFMENQYRPLLKEKGIPQIFQRLMNENQEIYNKMRDLNEERAKQPGAGKDGRSLRQKGMPPEEAALNDYYFSKGLDLVADIATRDDPDFDLRFFY